MTPEFGKAEEYILSRLRNELSPQLTYHGIHHTYDVLDAAQKIAVAEKVSANEILYLRVACCYHDCGFIYIYGGHEQRGCEIVRENLPRFNFNREEIEIICGMIMATKIPQSPVTHLEKIIADADLDYLGREDFYSIGKTLFEEMKALKFLSTEKEWNNIQVKFFKSHHYHTDYVLITRSREKESRLRELEKIVNSYF